VKRKTEVYYDLTMKIRDGERCGSFGSDDEYGYGSFICLFLDSFLGWGW
jgi:hypothetical protein